MQATIPGIYVDAAVSRQVSDGVREMQSLAGSGQLRRTVVFGLGTNGGFGLDQLNQVFAVAAGRHVVVVTSHCPYCGWTAGNNAMIHANCTAARKCTVADFQALANANPGWFVGDGVHMPIGGAGAQAYARVILAAL
ncbi:MAG: hypothetical protein DLM57_06980 [Pseudonocardiales bacterium]|nr:MAG: hypothetical protein DLM57_06980 [Pseudonocardiales bacterium]